MLNKFLNYFKESINVTYTGNLYGDYITQLGGKSFGKGLFRSFSKDNLAKWTHIVKEAYPQYKGEFYMFGYDWLGRCFAISKDKYQGESVLMFEIGTNDILQIPCNFYQFLNEEIPEYADACLAEPFYNEWLKYSKTEVTYDRCVAYKVPLFLGGKDTIDNLEDSDMEVYWSVLTQIKNQI